VRRRSPGPKERDLIVVLQILEMMAMLAGLVLLAMGRPLLELLPAFVLLYLVHAGEFVVEWRERRSASVPATRSFLLYLLPGVVLLRRLAELTIATLFVRLYLVLLMLLLLLTQPFAGFGRLDWRLGRLYDRLDRSVEPLFDVLLRGYNAVSLNPHPPGETGMVLAVPMPFRERLL